MIRRHIDFVCAVLLIGLSAGVAGAMTAVLLHWVEHLTFHYSFGTLLDGVAGSSPVRRTLGPADSPAGAEPGMRGIPR